MPPGLDIFRSFEWLRFCKPETRARETIDYRAQAPVPGIVRIPAAGIEISLELIEKAETFAGPGSVYNNKVACLNWARLSDSLELRNWRPGDRYWPEGGAGEEKIKTLFQQARVPLWERRHWPVLMDGPAIVWARRFGAAAEFAADSGTKVILRVRESETGGAASIRIGSEV